MKKAIIVFLIILVLGIIGGFVYYELSIPAITYVSDTSKEYGKGNRFVISRLYSSNVDADALKKMLDSSLITTEFTDEEILAAALKAGDPQLYLSFDFVVTENSDRDGYVVTGMIYQQLAKGQEKADFKPINLWLTSSVAGAALDGFEIIPADEEQENINSASVINEAKTALTAKLDDTSGFTMELTGDTATVTVRYTYDIISSGVLTTTAMTEQFFEINLTLGKDSNGEVTVAYALTPGNVIAESE